MVDGINSSKAPNPARGVASPAAAGGVGRAEDAPNPRIDGSGGLVTITGDAGDSSVPVLALPRNMDADVMMTLLYAIQQKQGRDQIKTSEQRIDDKRAERQKKHEEIMEMIKKAHEAEHKDKTGATVGKVFGWIGVGLAWAMVGIVAVVSGGAAAVPLAIAATAMTAFMICQETGATDKAIEAMNVDDKTAMGIQIGLAVTMLVIMIAATIASGGAAAGGVASGVADVASAGAEAGAAGAEVASAGAETGAAGAEVASAGAEAGAAGAEVASAGTEVASAGTEVASTGTEVASAGAEAGVEGATSGSDAVTGTVSRSGQLVRVANRLKSAAMIAQGVSQAGAGSAEIATAKYSYDGASARADAQDDRADMAKYQEITYEELRRIRKLIEQLQNAAAQVIGTIDQTRATAMKIRRTI